MMLYEIIFWISTQKTSQLMHFPEEHPLLYQSYSLVFHEKIKPVV